ncbi:helix-turn-helix domain-containing protein [Microtetraspora sp. AC03309]|uniref:helix-turn-helix transcriptional regulator n=1 Tax=Microtetraspora sp. AC03309 TaxID=2779376 RepID=UPI001E32A5E7|nr:helix-turn-helix transcriptional regulator [Microtetraspora sp. AC03309]MCC5578775.1 helix-turn-helix domain-containing protein [Microtetraspora sp. AC03309]
MNSATTGPGARRSQLGAFLRSRRERIAPQDVGLPPGLRRRTPGLRREEVAQLAGVGVTWYTWLEQGRPINASVQVLDAIARTLRLDAAELEHLYRLADLPEVPESEADHCIAAEVRTILDNLDPLAAGVYNSRYDLLAWNATYALLFANLVRQPPERRNALWQIFTAPDCCNPVVNRGAELPQMVGSLRAAYARHMGEPAWTGFVRRLSAESPDFAAMWATHDVARQGSRMKIFQHSAVGLIRMTSTSLALSSLPETRIVVYTPLDEESGARVARLGTFRAALVVDHAH